MLKNTKKYPKTLAKPSKTPKYPCNPQQTLHQSQLTHASPAPNLIYLRIIS